MSLESFFTPHIVTCYCGATCATDSATLAQNFLVLHQTHQKKDAPTVEPPKELPP